MIDIAAKRAKNLARVNAGIAKTGIEPITKVQAVTRPDKAWFILKLAMKHTVIENEDGKKVQTKDLAYPNLLLDADLNAIKVMYQTRNKMLRLSANTTDFNEYFSSIREISDAFACEIISNAIEQDETLLDKVYEIQVKEAEEKIKASEEKIKASEENVKASEI